MNDGFVLTSVGRPNISWCIHDLLEFKEVLFLLMLMFHNFCIKIKDFFASGETFLNCDIFGQYHS